jgi:hypothetical protein
MENKFMFLYTLVVLLSASSLKKKNFIGDTSTSRTMPSTELQSKHLETVYSWVELISLDFF